MKISNTLVAAAALGIITGVSGCSNEELALDDEDTGTARSAVLNGSDGVLPTTAVVSYTTSQGVQLGCTGTVIASRWILTAAHCLDKVDPITDKHTGLDTIDLNHGNVRVGWLDPAYSSPTAVNMYANAVYIHPSWQGQDWSSLDPSQIDVALIHTRDAAGIAPKGYIGAIGPDFAGGLQLVGLEGNNFPNGAVAQYDGLAGWREQGPKHATFVLDQSNILSGHLYKYQDNGVHAGQPGDSGGGSMTFVSGYPWLVSIHNQVSSDGTSYSIDTLTSVFRDWAYSKIPQWERVVQPIRPANAQGNDELVIAGSPGVWAAQNVFDGSLATAFSSNISGSATNSRNTWLAAWTPEPRKITQVVLGARLVSGAPNGFPGSYRVYITSPDNTQWVQVGAYSLQPQAQNNWTVTIDVPWGPVTTYGVWIVPDALGVDSYNNHYFQMGEVSLR